MINLPFYKLLKSRLFRSRGGNPAPIAWIALFAAVSYLGFMAFSDRWAIARYNHDVGHADEAAYALQARGLVLNGSLKVPYVTNFFHQYSPDIWRYDDHWPPFLAFLMAPFFFFGGVEASLAHALCVALGAMLVPLAAAWLGMAACRRVWAGLAMAILMLVNPLVFRESFRLLSDISLTAILVGLMASIIGSRRHPAYLLFTGLLAAAAFYAKGSQVILLGLIPLFAVVVHGVGILRSPWPYASIALAGLLLLPWWIVMWRDYGHPMHSTQNHVAAFYGIEENWDKHFYAVHWGKEPPGLRDRFNDYDIWMECKRKNVEIFMRSCLMGSGGRIDDWPLLGPPGEWMRGNPAPGRGGRVRPREKLAKPWYTIINLTGVIFGAISLALWPIVVLCAVCARAIRYDGCLRRLVRGCQKYGWPRLLRRFLRHCWRRHKGFRGLLDCGACRARPDTSKVKSLLGNSFAVSLMILIQASFVITLWSAEQIRMTMPIIPFAAVLACLALSFFTELFRLTLCRIPIGGNRGKVKRFRVRLRRWTWIGSLALCLVVVMVAGRHRENIMNWQLEYTKVRKLEKDFFPQYHAVAKALQDAGIGGDAVIMSRKPWQLLFYMPDSARGVGLPYARPKEIFSLARYYGVTHFLFDHERPGLKSFVERGHPGLIPVKSKSRFPVFKLDFTKFGDDELTNPIIPPGLPEESL